MKNLGMKDLAMNIETTVSHDGVELNYAYTGLSHDKCLALIIPFGLKLDLAESFFDFYRDHYDVVALESRLILAPEARKVAPEELAVDNHVEDLVSVLRACGISRTILVGYCSGAGIALAAANKYPELFLELILVHGEYVLLEEDTCTTQFAADIDSLLSLAAQSEQHAGKIFEKVSSDRPIDNKSQLEGIDTPFTQVHFLHRYAMNYLAYKSADFKALAHSVPHKCLLLTGNRDLQANVVSTQKIHGLMKKATIHVDPYADHYGILREDSKTLATIWNHLGI